jgi:hypothetical protein
MKICKGFCKLKQLGANAIRGTVTLWQVFLLSLPHVSFPATVWGRRKRVRKTAKTDYYLRHVRLSVRLYAQNNSAPTGRILMKLEFFSKIKTHILCSITFLHKLHRIWDNAVKCGERGATNDVTIWRIRVAAGLARLHALMRMHTSTRPSTHTHSRTHARTDQ